MSTRSRIGILNKDGSIDSVYHHFDGYPEWLGVKLKQNYQNSCFIREELIEEGDLSCIESHQDWDRKELTKPIVLSYKMRGEDCPAAHHETLSDFLDYDTVQTEYSYLWNPEIKHWICWKHYFSMTDYIRPALVAIPDKTRPEALANS